MPGSIPGNAFNSPAPMGRGKKGIHMWNVYEIKGEQKWFFKCLGDDKFTAEVLFSHLVADWSNGHHLTELILINE